MEVTDDDYPPLRRRGEDRLEGTPEGWLYGLLVKAYLNRPKMLVSSLLILLAGGGGALGTGVGAKLLPYALTEELSALDQRVTLHIAEAEKVYLEIQQLTKTVEKLAESQCSSDINAQITAIENRLKAVEKEQWDLQGALEANEATQRDRDRLGALNIEQRELTDKKSFLRTSPCED